MGSFSVDYQYLLGGGESSDGQELEGAAPTITDTTVKVQSNASAGSRYWGGLAFNGPTMPAKGATITAATLQIYCNDAATDDANFVIWGHDVAIPPPIAATTANISGLTRTTASVSWVANSLGTGWKTSDSLVSIISELVTDYSVAGIVLILKPNTDSSKTCTFSAWDEASHALGAKLHLEWTEPGTRALTDQDCQLSEFNPNTNSDGGGGGGGPGITERWGKLLKTMEEHVCMRCDFSAEIPAVNTIDAASLWLCMGAPTYTAGYPPSDYTFTINRCLREWVTTQATYNIYSTGNSWATPGARGFGTDYATTDGVFKVGVDVAGWWEWDVFDLVEYAHADDQILNIVLHSPTSDFPGEANSYMVFHSYKNATNRPFLMITHTSPGGVKTRTPVWF